jgi:hypothetical protein
MTKGRRKSDFAIAAKKPANKAGSLAAEQSAADSSCIEKDLAALEHMQRARMNFGARICEASRTKDQEVLKKLRLEDFV